MDVTNPDHYSDSDSGESWTLLERCPSCADVAPATESPIPQEEEVLEKENSDKDEDTDGISIISDSDPENATPSEHLNYYYNFSDIKDHHSIENNLNMNFSVVQNTPGSSKDKDESLKCEDDFLSDNTGKLKTYVHKRNKKLSTVLNVILLGSVITAAGVAIGHMWGVKDDCLMHSTSSVNKILSNLYKLQEENALLRSKIRELTNALQTQQKKSGVDKSRSVKYPRCKKIFEEPLNNKDAVEFTKCVDLDNEHMIDRSYEQEFVSDMDKLKAFYKQNKSWLDNEISRRLKGEAICAQKAKEILKPIQTDVEKDRKGMKDINLKLQLQQPVDSVSEDMLDIINSTSENDMVIKKDKNGGSKISYADSLKSSAVRKSPQEEENKVNKERSNEKRRNAFHHNKAKREIVVSQASLSDMEAKKDDRYMGHKYKHDLKKHDRQKAHKRQKRKNKYEQWEMNRGYIKNYDEPPDVYDDYILNIQNKIKNEEYARWNYIKHLSEKKRKKYDSQHYVNNDGNVPETGSSNDRKKGDDYETKPDWLEMRAEFRNEARKKLNQKLFAGNDNSARWYFRRMQRREQCRSKGDNIRRNHPKKHSNYKDKTKHTG